MIDLSALYAGTYFGGLKAGTESQVATLSGHKAIFYTSGGQTFLVGDTDGVAGADFAIELTGTIRLAASDLLIGRTAAASERMWNQATDLDYGFHHNDLLWV